MHKGVHILHNSTYMQWVFVLEVRPLDEAFICYNCDMYKANVCHLIDVYMIQMSGSRMKVAGRFKPCVHMGCFDLDVFVEMNQRSRKASN